MRVAIVGCGKMGRERARAARALGAEVALVADVARSQAEALAATCGPTARAVDAARVDLDNIDAVFVCTPPCAHGPVERMAIEAGIPFLVEKPIGLSAEHCEGVLGALRERPVVHAVGYMSRYRRSVRAARQRLSGARVLGITAAWVGKVYGRPWWLDQDGSGGPFNEQGTHLVDLCRFLGGEIVEVAALSSRSLPDTEVEDAFAVALRFEGGALGTLLYSCLGAGKEVGVEVFSSAGRIRLEGWDLRDAGEGSGAEDVFDDEVSSFFSAVESGRQELVACDYEDAWRTQRVVDAIRWAAVRGGVEAVMARSCP